MLGLQLHVGQVRDVREIRFAVRNSQESLRKPWGCFWTSTYRDGRSAWVDWCESMEYRVPDVWEGILIQPLPSARIFVVDDLADMDWLLCKYGRMFNPQFRSLDFERIARDYDAIHLTENGVSESWLHPRLLFGGWDAESTCWFRPVFRQVGSVRFPVRLPDWAMAG